MSTVPPFDPSLYTAFERPSDVERHTGPCVCVGSHGLARPGDVHACDDIKKYGWGNFAPFVQPATFADVREMYSWMGQPGSKLVSTLGARDVYACSERGRWSTEGGNGFTTPTSHDNWRPYCPVWDAPKPSAEDMRQEAIREFRYLQRALCVEFNVGGNGLGYLGDDDRLMQQLDLTNCTKLKADR